MRIGMLGINHKSAELFYRELVAKACQTKLHQESALAERLSCVLLLTCNRTEIYFSAEDLGGAHSALLGALREEIGVPFEHKLYAYFGCDCFIHLAKVTAGLDSMIVAESEIQRQVKVAYEQTALYYGLPSIMHFLFQKSLGIGKYIRSHFALPTGQLSLPKMVYEVCGHVFCDKKAFKVLFIGNSEINRKVLHFFKHRGIVQIALCTRSILSAEEFALKNGLHLIDWRDLSLWEEFDVVVSGTNTASYLITAPQGSPSKTRLIFDLGVPRNIDPRLVRHPHITLLNIDELGDMIEKRQKKHCVLIEEASKVIEEKVRLHSAARVYACV